MRRIDMRSGEGDGGGGGRQRVEKPAPSGFRQSMAALHTWTGLLPGWLLFVIFLFGTSAFFQDEISRWMRPELPAPAPVSARALAAADRLLARDGAGAKSWSLSLPSTRDADGLTVSWMPEGGKRGDRVEHVLDPQTGQPITVRDTRGGYFLYRMHFDLHYLPVMWARILVCIAALAMLVAILSGIVTHKKIFADFFLLRFGKGQRSWLDAHNVTAVLALPFHLMITYTGLVTLLFTLMPWAISANFPSSDAYFKAAYPQGPEVEASGTAAPVLSIANLLQRARTAEPDFVPSYMTIDHPGDAAAVAAIRPRNESLTHQRVAVFLNAATGDLLSAPRSGGAASATRDVMVNLHMGHFAGPGLRWLYFLSGVGGTVMVGSGLVLWTVKRRAKLPDPARPPFGLRLAERLNVAVVAGAPAGIATYFLANRLLPVGMAHRAEWEINSLFILWGAVLAWGIARPVKRAWIEGLALGAVLYTLIPIVSAATTEPGLAASLRTGDPLFVAFDLVMLALGLTLALATWRVATHKPKGAPRRRSRGLQEATA